MAITAVSPARGKSLKSSELVSDAQIGRKLRKAADTAATFQKTSSAQRARTMMMAAQILQNEKENLARIWMIGMEKALCSALEGAVQSAWVCRYSAEKPERFVADVVHIN